MKERMVKHCGALAPLLLALALLLPLALPAQQHKLTEEEAREKYGLHATVKDEWAIAAWEWCRDRTLDAYDWTRDQVEGMLFDDMEVENADQVGLAFPVLMALLMLFSGCWAASIAQMRRHPRTPFFILGAVAILVGPIALLFKLDIKGEAELKARIAQEAAEKRAEAAAKAALEEQQALESGKQTVPQVSDTGVVWDRKYFESIANHPDGTPAGPWDVVYNGGVQARVLTIIEAQDAFVQVRFINMAGKEMVGRIPLARLESWKEA